MTALPQPNTATDKAFITTQIASLTRPLNSSVIPPALLLAHNTTLSQALRLKLSASAVRKTLEQLQGLREKETRKRERRAEKESQGRVVVSKLANKGSGGKGKERATWVDELPKTWPVREDRAEVDEDAAARYEQALRRVKALRKQRERTLQQLTHYRKLEALANSITPEAISSHTLEDSDSALRVALDETAELLPGVVEEVETDMRELVALKRSRRAHLRDDENSGRVTGAAAGVALGQYLAK